MRPNDFKVNGIREGDVVAVYYQVAGRSLRKSINFRIGPYSDSGFSVGERRYFEITQGLRIELDGESVPYKRGSTQIFYEDVRRVIKVYPREGPINFAKELTSKIKKPNKSNP